LETKAPKESKESPHQVAVYMVGARVVPDLAAAGGSGGSTKTPAQAMSDLMAEMAKLVDTPVTTENQEKRNVKLAKLHTQIIEVQKEIDAENARMADLQMRIHQETERLKDEA